MTPTDKPHVVNLDFDGTIADVDGGVPEPTRKAIRQARDGGHYVFS